VSDEFKPIEWRDVTGREVQVGATVAYATTYADSVVMKFGRVVELGREKGYGTLGRPKIKLIAVDRGFRGQWELHARAVTISLNAAMIVPRTFVPAEALVLLDSKSPAEVLAASLEQEAALGMEVSMRADKDLRADDMPNNLGRP
jgi:hypothetical protein